MMNYKEAQKGASQDDLQKYAPGIRKVIGFVKRLHSQGLLPERFSPEPSRLHPFLEGKVRIEPWTIGGKDGQKLLAELVGRGRKIGSYARSMVESRDFTTLPEPQEIEVGILKVGDLGIKKDYPTFAEIEARRDELGLDSLPAEALLHYLIENGDKLQRGEPLIAGMKPIADSVGIPSVFDVVRNAGGLWLRDRWALPDSLWDPGVQFAFGVRK